MRHAPSLYDEKKALLAHMQATRTDYRRMLEQVDKPDVEPDRPALQLQSAPFPRSATLRWMFDHPYVCAIGVAALVWSRPVRIVNSPKVHAIADRTAALTATALRIQSQVLIAAKVLATVRQFLAPRSTRH